MLKVKCIGFSVTGYGYPPYPVLLQQELKKDCSSEVEFSAVGGLSIDSLPSLMSIILKNNFYDVIILELATSWFSFLNLHDDVALKYIRSIYFQALKSSKRVIFLNLYRRDIEDNDTVVRAINALCLSKSCLIDLKRRHRELFLLNQNDGTTDGVHPNDSVISEIAYTLAHNILTTHDDDYLSHQKAFAKSYINNVEPGIYFPILDGFSSYQYDRHGVVLTAWKIPASEIVRIQNPHSSKFSGVFFIYGPNSLNSTISDGVVLNNVISFDKFSYYYRLGYSSFNSLAHDEILVSVADSNDSSILVKEPESIIENALFFYLVGFSHSL